MTITAPRQSRSNTVRVIASALCFTDPPIIRTLSRARDAAAGVYDALVEAGIITGDGPPSADGNDDPALFAGDGAATPPGEDSGPAADPEA